MPRVLRLFHSAVVPEFRERERLLRERHRWDVHVACPPAWYEGGRLVDAGSSDGVPLHVLPIRGRTTHPILFWYDHSSLRALLRELRPDVVDVHEEPYSLAALGAVRAAAREVPHAPVCVYTAQNIHKRYPLPFRLAERYVLRRAAAAYPCSTEAGDVLRRKGFSGRLDVLPLGVSPGSVRPPANGRRRVGFVGRLVHEKGADVALSAFAGVGEGVTLELVGSGPEECRLRELARRLRLGDRVVFTGAVTQDEALGRIASYDVLVVPSRTTPSWKEQFGRVAAQALAAGTVVVASDSGSLPELLDGCGELVPEGDPAALAERLRGLLADPERRAKLAQSGRRRAEAALSWERVAAGFDRMYRDALEAV